MHVSFVVVQAQLFQAPRVITGCPAFQYSFLAMPGKKAKAQQNHGYMMMPQMNPMMMPQMNPMAMMAAPMPQMPQPQPMVDAAGNCGNDDDDESDAEEDAAASSKKRTTSGMMVPMHV